MIVVEIRSSMLFLFFHSDSLKGTLKNYAFHACICIYDVLLKSIYLLRCSENKTVIYPFLLVWLVIDADSCSTALMELTCPYSNSGLRGSREYSLKWPHSTFLY
uniref:Uncharacterized protein n=1 Tax=Oryza brachyantha TaxID=4533 RepID=J3MBN0_ORYBR